MFQKTPPPRCQHLGDRAGNRDADARDPIECLPAAPLKDGSDIAREGQQHISSPAVSGDAIGIGTLRPQDVRELTKFTRDRCIAPLEGSPPQCCRIKWRVRSFARSYG